MGLQFSDRVENIVGKGEIPHLGFSNSAANKDMTSKIWTTSVTII